MKNPPFAIVTPVRNEEKILKKTMNSVISQSVRPERWIFINDGSTDNTINILESFRKDHKWIEVINIKKEVKCYRGVQEKLYLAFDKLDFERLRFVGKLDADIELPNYYFEKLFEKFYKNEDLGIAGGMLFFEKNGQKIIEKEPLDHVRGGLKMYRVQCWHDIGGMDFKLGYDMIDEVKANMKGWKTRSYPEILALHHRPTGKQKGIIGWCRYRGYLAYVAGYTPLLLFLRAIKNLKKKPLVIGSIAEMYGYCKCYLDGTERTISDRNYMIYLKKKKIRRIYDSIKSLK